MSPLTWAIVLLAGVAGVYSLGSDTTVSAWPSLVQVEDRLGALWIQQCGGSLINSLYVLTAASCTTPNSVNNRRLRAGATQRGTDGQVAEASAIIVHDSYGNLGNDGDIALIRTATQFVLGQGVQQARILGQGIQLPVNLVVTFVSWGITAGDNNNNLKELNLRVVNIDACTNKYLTAENPQTITENMICTGLTYNSGRDVDSRDFGAPILYDGVTVGVTSFGVIRGDDEFPIVASAISSYTSWIVDVANQI